jgi:hypothetical protein
MMHFVGSDLQIRKFDAALERRELSDLGPVAFDDHGAENVSRVGLDAEPGYFDY